MVMVKAEATVAEAANEEAAAAFQWLPEAAAAFQWLPGSPPGSPNVRGEK